MTTQEKVEYWQAVKARQAAGASSFNGEGLTPDTLALVRQGASIFT